MECSGRMCDKEWCRSWWCISLGCVTPLMTTRACVQGDRSINIVVTQPRRIAAVSVAKRVAHLYAQFQGEEIPLGDTVGYSIARERKSTPGRTKLTFMTVGFLLQLLSHNPKTVDRSEHSWLCR